MTGRRKKAPGQPSSGTGKGRGRPRKGARLRERREANRRVVLLMVCGDDDESTGLGPEQRDLAEEMLDAWCAKKGYVRDDTSRGGAPGDQAGGDPTDADVGSSRANVPAPAEARLPDLNSSIAEAIAWYLAGRRPVEAAATARAWGTYYSYASRLKPVIEHCGDRLVRDVDQSLVNELATWHSRQLLRCTQRRLAREEAGFAYNRTRQKPRPPRRVKASTVVSSLRALRTVIIAVFGTRRYGWLPTMTIPEVSEEPAGAPIFDAQVERLLRACHGLIWDHERGTWQREPDVVREPVTGEERVRTRRVVDRATGAIREVECWRFKRRLRWIVERRQVVIRLIVILLATGSRASVAKYLTWDKRPENSFVDERLEILHRKGTEEMDGRTKKRPPVRILETLRRHLLRWRAEDARFGLGYVLHQANGAPMESMVGRFAAVARDAGLEDVTIHHLRHTVIARLIGLGLNLNEISDFVGATVETIQKHYNKLKIGQERVVAVLDQRTRVGRSRGGELAARVEEVGVLPPPRSADDDQVGTAVEVVVAALRRSGDTAAAAAILRLLPFKGGADCARKTPSLDGAAPAPRPDPIVVAVAPKPTPPVALAVTAIAIETAMTIILTALRASDNALSGRELNDLVMGEGLSRDRAEQAKVRLKRAGQVVHRKGNFWSLPDASEDGRDAVPSLGQACIQAGPTRSPRRLRSNPAVAARQV